MVERLLDHLSCVEVALRHDECASRGGVRRGVAVGRDEPHDVVGLVAAGQVGATLALHVVDVGVLGDVAGVVGERVAQERHGDGIELDGVDLPGAIRQRRLDLVSARRPDDEHVRLLVGRRGERDLPVVRGEAVGGCRRAVVAPDGRAPQAVVVQDVVVAEPLRGVDPEDGTPVTRLDVGIAAQRLRLVGAHLEPSGHDGTDHHGDRAQCRPRHTGPTQSVGRCCPRRRRRRERPATLSSRRSSPVARSSPATARPTGRRARRR